MTLSAESRPTGTERRALQALAFDRIGESYDEAFPHKDGQRDSADWLIERLKPGSRVLDVGCGTGLPTARQFAEAGHEVIGIDISPGMLELARRDVPQATFLELDLAELADGRLGRFDGVVAFFSILMLPRSEITGALTLIRDLLTPGGHMLLSMVEADVDDMPLSFLGSTIWVTGYLRDELREIVEDAGFSVLDMRALSVAPASTQAQPEIQLFLNCRRDDSADRETT